MTTPDRSPDTDQTQLVPLAMVPRELAAIASGEAVSYRMLYARVLDGLLPARKVNGRWHIHRADMAAIAQAFGLSVKAPSQTSRRRGPFAPIRSVAA